LSFEYATAVEMALMTKLLWAGFKSRYGVYPGTYLEQKMQEQHPKTTEQQLMENMKKLRMQAAAVRKGERMRDSPPESPKGSVQPRDVDLVNANNTPNQPRRRSEPQLYSGGLGAGIDISPLRASGSRAVSIRDPKTGKHATPTRVGKKKALAVGETIHEEDEE
jgi:hypothetical protein